MSTAVFPEAHDLPSTTHPVAATRVTQLRPTPLWWRDATAVAGWSLVLFVVALWVTGGGITDFTSTGELLTNLGRLSGLVASVLILIQVLLMARIPMLEQSWGQDELARVHRLVGNTSFNLLIAHIGLTIVGYSVGTDLGVVATFVDEVLHSPGMLLALAGAVALVMVVVTSVKKGRKRLPTPRPPHPPPRTRRRPGPPVGPTTPAAPAVTPQTPPPPPHRRPPLLRRPPRRRRTPVTRSTPASGRSRCRSPWRAARSSRSTCFRCRCPTVTTR